MQSDKTQEILDRLEALARELGAVGAETAGQLVESYARRATAGLIGASNISLVLVVTGLLMIRSGARLKSAHESSYDVAVKGSTLIVCGALIVAGTSLIGGGIVTSFAQEMTAPEWHVVQELLR